MHAVLGSLFALFILVSTTPAPGVSIVSVTNSPSVKRLPDISSNDNRRPAGTLANGTLVLQLRAAVGVWRPEKDKGPSLEVEAFAEVGSALTVPSPLIRVPEGTEVVATIANELTHALRVHGLCTRGGPACAPLEIPAGESREARFATGPAGTYHYWATTTGMPLGFRGAGDTQLSGAFIVDPPGAAPNADRVLVITEWSNLTREQLQAIARADDPGAVFFGLNPRFTFLINGLSWPSTERLTYGLGERVRWRVLNLSTQRHPMHLHGFYFEVQSLGDGLRDTAFASGQAPRVVTQLLSAGATMMMEWTPERIGNWLFHCHVMDHVSPERSLASGHEDHHASHSASAGMAGMVLGVTIVGSEAPTAEAEGSRHEWDDAARVKLTLVMDDTPPGGPDQRPVFGFALVDSGSSTVPARVSVPGPLMVLRHGEPVEIALVNHLPEGTAIHWHGMELESYYDGVHGWSGHGSRVTPLIEPAETFAVRFTPPRAGTFMYHTHLHDRRQLTSGLYGPMIVLEPDQTFDPTTDHVFMLGRSGPEVAAPVLLNGSRSPQDVWKAGSRHRVRLINITPDDILSVSLQTPDGPIVWTPLTKDGATLPAAQCKPVPARQTIGVGETYDFEVQTPAARQNWWLEVRSTGGKWQVQGQVVVR